MTYSINIKNTTEEHSHITVFQKPAEAQDFPVNPWRTVELDSGATEFSFEIPGIDFRYAVSANLGPGTLESPLLRVQPGCTYIITGDKESGCSMELVNDGF